MTNPELGDVYSLQTLSNGVQRYCVKAIMRVGDTTITLENVNDRTDRKQYSLMLLRYQGLLNQREYEEMFLVW